MNNFKNKHSFNKRKEESCEIIKKYPERVPVIVQKHHSSDLPDTDKCKFLVPKDLTISQFHYIIRKRIELDPSQTLFMMIDNSLVSGSTLLSSTYEDKKDPDGFLYVTYTNENTFG